MTDVPAYLPPDLAVHIRDSLPRLTADERWEVERVAEAAYAQGYAAGHERGYTSAWVEARRGHAQPSPSPQALPGAYDPPEGNPPWTSPPRPSSAPQ